MIYYRSVLLVLLTTFFSFDFCLTSNEIYAQRAGGAIYGRQRMIGRLIPRTNSVRVRVSVPNVPFGHMYQTLPKYYGSTVPPATAGQYSAPITAYDSRYREQKERQSPTRILSNGSIANSKMTANSRAVNFPIIHTLGAAKDFQLEAEQAFRSGQYAESAKLVERAMQIDRHNGLLKLFSSHANFATGRYRIAATLIDQATQLLGPDEWNFFGENFQRFYGRNDYVPQTRSLAAHVERRPDDYQAKVLLGYHYGIAGHLTSATELFREALRQNPQDALAQRLIPVIGDPTLDVRRSNAIQAPSPEFASTWVRKQSRSRQHAAPKRIYLTPQFATAGSSVQRWERPMSANELTEAPAEIFVPKLNGPANAGEFQSVLEELEELPAPLEHQ